MLMLVAAALSLAAAPDHRRDSENPKPSSDVERSLNAIASAQNQIAEAADTREYQKPCADGQPNYKSDLCAQWHAADAAKDAAYWSRWAVLVSIIGAAGIVAALVLTIQSNNIARQTARLQLRAYISVDEFGLDFDKDRDGPNTSARPFVAWKNSGQTPAIAVSEHFNWELRQGDLPDDFDFADDPACPDRGQLVVGPGHGYSSPSERVMTLQEFLAIADGRLRCFAWGWSEYTDIYGEGRRTEIAAELKAAQLKSGEHHIRFETLGRHNAMDDDCMKKPCRK